MKITAQVIYPVSVSIDVPSFNGYIDPKYQPKYQEIVKNRILEEAEQIINTSTIKPIIHDCNNPDLID